MPEKNSRVPQPTRPFRHSVELQLRFNDIDMFGHVNNAIYLQYFDLGKLRYFSEAIGPDFAEQGFTAVIVNINCDFFAPAVLSERLAVLSAVVHIGEKSLVLEQRIINVDTDEVKSVCRTTMAGFDPLTLCSAPIPGNIRAALEQYEG